MRRHLYALAATAFAATAAAATPPSSAAPLNLSLSPQDKGTEPVQFLDRSVVFVPKALGKYKLIEATYDPAQLAAGVSTDWRIDGTPADLKVDVYVFPIGRGPEDEIVRTQADHVVEEIKYVTQQGVYSAYEIGARGPFSVVRGEATAVRDPGKPTPRFDPNPQPETRLEVKPGTDPVTQAIADNWRPPNLHGTRQHVSMTRDGHKYRSLAYMFYQHLFAYSVRISVPEDEMEQAPFEKAADEAARWLVPQIDVQNFGTCGTLQLPSKNPGESDEQSGARLAPALIAGISRIKFENCANSEGDKKQAPANAQRFDLVYPAGTWKDQH